MLRLARPFFARMIVADPYADRCDVAELGASVVPIEEMMRRGRFVVVCCLLNEETRHLIDARKFALMKPTAYYLNVGRGPDPRREGLAYVLKAGRIAGAGLDVTEREPIEPDSPLLGMENVIITPHALCGTDECFTEIAATALQSLSMSRSAVDRRTWSTRRPCADGWRALRASGRCPWPSGRRTE